MVKHIARISRGQRVFIHGMSRAVGYTLLTLCQFQDAQVYDTTSTRNHAALQELDDTSFVYIDKAWMTAIKLLRGADEIFDALGFESWDESYSILSKIEVLVGYGRTL
jgi:NADPH:quinone reductase-like Zn-dependent oxidoreductase